MISTKFGSIRSRSGSNSKKGPEIALVGVRYEKTVQAEPPKPMPPRSSSRVPSRAHSTRSPTPSSPTSMYAPSLASSHSPIVVAPPLTSIATVAPPAEQHPALRTPVQQTKGAEGWKRDSGHAPTPTSSATIREEDNEDDGEDCCSNSDSAPWSAAIDKLIRAGVMPSSVAQHLDRRAPEDRASGDEPVCATEGTVTSASPSRTIKTSSVHTTSPQQLSRHVSASPTSPTSPSRRGNLLKRFSVRSSASSSARGKLPAVLIDEGSSAAPPPITPMEPLESPARLPPAPANKQPLEPPQSPSATSLQSWPAVPATTSKSQDASLSPSLPSSSEDAQFTPLGLSIPTVALLDDDSMATISFSNRGSIMFGGRRVAGLGLDVTPIAEQPDAEPRPLSNEQSTTTTMTTTTTTTTTTATTTTVTDSDDAATTSTAPRAPLPPPDIRVISADVEKESQKVRSLYGVGDAISWEDGARHSYCEPLSPTPEDPIEDDGNDSPNRDAHGLDWAIPRSTSSFVHHKDSKLETELAGGLEDWEDVDGADVDRYGFIAVPRATSRAHTPTDLGPSRLSPRRRNVLHKRDPMGLSVRRTPSRKISARSLNTQNSEMSIASIRSSRSVIRQAGNLLPHNRDRRWMDEAGEMLTVSPNMQDAFEEAEIQRISESLKRKEWERSEKWRKMAKIVRKGGQGEGMEFEFDIKNPKLIERTWKGIPDRWRATAWWSFLSASAKQHQDSPMEDEIIAAFYRLLEQGSPDDVQIDLDVPRTISRHIMFRRRYRGGQRLLFRVLHALSIYFPETGYVQGMASLAATLLCYFDEEKCFVMLVRMWQLRGLDRLYRPGFEGLMTALKEFDETWLNKDVAKKLNELSVDITAYGTRWYLTLFNLSIPFPAQLRVWDVYLLLGDGAFTAQSNISPATKENGSTETSGLDVLHATSAALVQALREVLLDSDFENAMKALTSWIPIKDEDLLMKVTKAEWKSHQGKKKT